MLYATTFLLALVIVGAGLTMVTVQNDKRRIQRNMSGSEAGFLLAQAGTEWILRQVEEDPAWRTTFTSGVAESLAPRATDSISVTLTDSDGNLADNDTDGVTVTSTGISQGSKCNLTLTAQTKPHPLLSYAVAAGTEVWFMGTETVSGPIYCGSTIHSDIAVVTTAEGRYETPSGGSIDGDLIPQNTAAAAKSLPTPDLSYYTARATSVAPTGGGSIFEFFNVNLTPTNNSQGTPNAEGVYLMDARGYSQVQIRSIHVKGTLIILFGSGAVRFEQPCWFETAATGYPVLLVDTSAGGSIEMAIPTGTLSETTSSVDFNEDGDKVDIFTTKIEGLVWADADYIRMYQSAWSFKGCMISDKVWTANGVMLDDDPAIAGRLIPGFTDGVLHVQRGTIK